MSEMSVILSLFLALSCVVGCLEASAEVGFGEVYHPNSIDRFTSSDDAEVEFLLFTKDTIQDPEKVTVDDEEKLFNGKLDITKPTKFIVHGWLDTWKAIYAQSMIASFLPEYDYNVIVVNWPEADSPLYYPSREKVPVVGKILGRLLDRLGNENGLNVSSVHVIGHSLGAHVAAVAGYSSKFKIGKITEYYKCNYMVHGSELHGTHAESAGSRDRFEGNSQEKLVAGKGLDPALPLFFVGGTDTLSQKAAGFVEVVHTCGNFLGMFDEIGHVDFYPNDGVPFQPGCTLNLSCSHKRSFKFYSEAVVNSTAFLGTECSDWHTYQTGGCAQNQKIFMSDSTPTSARGKFFLKTAASSPYGLGSHS